MLIIKTEEDRERCTSCYGNHTIELTMEEVVALFAGATLAIQTLMNMESSFDWREIHK